MRKLTFCSPFAHLLPSKSSAFKFRQDIFFYKIRVRRQVFARGSKAKNTLFLCFSDAQQRNACNKYTLFSFFFCFLFVVQKIFLPLQRIWFATAIKRELGVNPKQSGCCELSLWAQTITTEQGSGRGLWADNKVRRPALFHSASRKASGVRLRS